MTTITHHRGGHSRLWHSLPVWVTTLTDLGHYLHAAWRRRQNLRVLENLPADTLKDIGWPTTDNKRMRIVRK